MSLDYEKTRLQRTICVFDMRPLISKPIPGVDNNAGAGICDVGGMLICGLGPERPIAEPGIMIGEGRFMGADDIAGVRVSLPDEKVLGGEPATDTGDKLPLPDMGVSGDDSVGEAPACPNVWLTAKPDAARGIEDGALSTRGDAPLPSEDTKRYVTKRNISPRLGAPPDKSISISQTSSCVMVYLLSPSED